jgi:hypothetical protein
MLNTRIQTDKLADVAIKTNAATPAHEQQKMFLEVYFPGQKGTGRPGNGSIILANAHALQFFLESLYHGNAYFQPGETFEIWAFKPGELSSSSYGIFKMEKLVLNNLLVEVEDHLAGIIQRAWGQMNARMNLKYHMMAHNLLPSQHITLGG